MKKLCLAAMLMTALAFGAKTAHAQTVRLDNAIQNVAAEFSPNIRRGASVAIIAMQADSVGMSNHLINGMIAALFRMRTMHGFEVASRGQIEMLLAEHELNMYGWIDDASAVSIGRFAGVQFIITGTFVPAGNVYRFWAQLIEVETGLFRGISTVDVFNDNTVASLLGAAGRAPRRRDPEQPRANWLSGEATILGGGMRYERDINRFFSLGGNIFYNSLPSNYGWFLRAIGALATARLFPGGVHNPFYAEISAGWGITERTAKRSRINGWDGYQYWHDIYSASGFMVAPALGVRFGGQRTGFFANPFVSLPMVLGRKEWGTMFHSWENGGPSGNVSVHFRAGIGLGGAW